MLRDDTIHGHLGHRDRPFWQPLEDLVGIDLADWFMWMSDIELEDETFLHAYKHIATRRYLHLHEDGRAFMYAGLNRYREIHPRDAIDEAFTNWEASLLPSDDPAEIRTALEVARSRASSATREA
jgi:hypothetical protein